MIIVDSTVWVDCFRGVENPESRWVVANATTKTLGLADVILCEVLQGFRGDSLFRQVLGDLLEFAIIETAGVQLAVQAAQNYRILRSKGYAVATIDCLIATLCITNAYSLLHRDRDFDAFEEHLGLSVIHP